MNFQIVIILGSIYFSAVASEEVAQGKDETLTNSNWTAMLEDEWLVKFYAPWCPACRHLESTWDSLTQWLHGKGVQLGSIDVTKESGLSGRFIITSLPTIYHVKGGVFRVYTNPRSLEDLQSFIAEEKWKGVEPVSQWKSPNSFIMSCISKLFEVSMQLKDVHTSLTESYGLPVWASFVIFGIFVIIIGLLLGMGMVLASDYFFGPPCPPSYPTMDKSDENQDEKQSEDSVLEDIQDLGEQDTGIRKRQVNETKDERN